MSIAALTSNGMELPQSLRYFSPLRESRLSMFADGSAQARFAEDGCLMLRGAVPADTVVNVREAYFRLFDPRVKNGDARRGEFSGYLPVGLPPHGTAGHPAHTFVRSKQLMAFRQLLAFCAISEALFGGPAKVVWQTPLQHFIRGSNTRVTRTSGPYLSQLRY